MPMAQRTAAIDGDATCGAAGIMGRIDVHEERSDNQTAVRAEFKQRSKEKGENLPRNCKSDG